MVKRVLIRFARGLVAGAVASMAVIIPANIDNLSDIFAWLQILAVSGIVGGISGGLLALDKMFRDSKTTE